MSILFSASDDIVDVGSPSALDNIWDGGGTAMIWFNAVDYGSGGGGDGRLFQKNFLFFLLNTNDTIQLLIVFSGGNARWEMPANTMVGNFGTWHHAAVTYDADSTANDPVFYFDGALVSTVEIAVPSGTRTTDVGVDLGIGNRPSALSRQFNGSLEDPRLYNRILSAAEIQTIYNIEGADGIVDDLLLRYLMVAGRDGVTITDPTILQDIGPFGLDGSIEGILEWDEIRANRIRKAA